MFVSDFALTYYGYSNEIIPIATDDLAPLGDLGTDYLRLNLSRIKSVAIEPINGKVGFWALGPKNRWDLDGGGVPGREPEVPCAWQGKRAQAQRPTGYHSGSRPA